MQVGSNMLSALLERLDSLGAFGEPLRYLFDPNRRVCLLYLLPTLLFAFLWSRWPRRRVGSGEAATFKVSPGRWFRRSSRLDLSLFIVHALFGLLGLGAIVLPALSVMAFVAGALSLLFGAAAPLGHWDRPLIAGLFTVVFLLADDASRYFLHRAFHRFRPLWQLHQVHHSADMLTPLTLYRIHPLESLAYQLRGGLVQGVVTGIFFFLFRDGLSAWEIVGVNVFGFFFNLFLANLRHSHIFLSFGPVLSRYFISPAQHQIHHSTAPEHADKNLGSFLAVWDRLFGTLLVPKAPMELDFGLTRGESATHTGLYSALVSPLFGFGRQLYASWSRRRANSKSVSVKPPASWVVSSTSTRL